MSELIRNLELALDEMAKVGNEVGIRIIEKAIRQANKLSSDNQPPSENNQP